MSHTSGRPLPHLNSKRLPKTTTRPRRFAPAAALALLLAAAPAAAAPARSEELADTLHSAIAALWDHLADGAAVFVGLWSEIGAGIDPGGTPTPQAPAQATGGTQGSPNGI